MIRARAPFLAAGVLALLAGLWGGLARLGLDVGAPPTFAAGHGLLMTMGFLGTVIGLERAVALRRRLAYAVPAIAAIATVALLLGLSVAPWLLVAAAVAFASANAYMLRVRPDLSVATMGLGGLAWIAAALALAIGAEMPRIVPLIAAFLVLTIVGERLELSKLSRPPAWAGAAFVLACAVLAAGAAAALTVSGAARVAGAGLVALALWLAVWDIAWRTVRRPGATRYIALALIGGYVWLAAAGVTWILAPDGATVFAYDALVHTVFVGFVMSMIFAHELVIVPAVAGIALPFTRAFYLPLALLHASLTARIAGDAAGDAGVWQWAATTNVIAVLLFAAVTVGSARGLLGSRTAAGSRRASRP